MQNDLSVKIEALRTVGVRLFELLDALEKAHDLPALQKRRVSDRELAQLAHAQLKERQDRSLFLPAELFSEPAWDMLLDLFVSDVKQRDVSVTSVCLATSVPATTALRWLDALHKLGLVERFASASDRRVTLIQLSKAGRKGMRDYLMSYYEAEEAESSKRMVEDRGGRVPALTRV